MSTILAPVEAVQLPTDDQPVGIPRGRGSIIGQILLYAALLVAAAALLLPFYWMVVSSLKRSNDVFTVPIRWWPDTIIWQNYVEIWQKSDMTTWLSNTLLLSVVVTVLQVLTGSFAAYGFSKVRFPGRDFLFICYVGTIAVPWQSYMIPQFILMSQFGLTDKRPRGLLAKTCGFKKRAHQRSVICNLRPPRLTWISQ